MKNSDLKITVVADNRAEAPLVAEHGLALWIEAGDRKILLDTGQGLSLIANAALLDIDIRETDALVLSHGHYDHTGSVSEVLKAAPQAQIYLHPAVFLPRYSISARKARPVQAPGRALNSIISHPERKVNWINGPAKVAEGISLTGPIPREAEFEDTGGPFFLDQGGKKPDLIIDDLAMWLDTDDGLVVCTGCCHSGIINTLRYVISLTGRSRVRKIVGGLHLVNASEERLERTAEELNKLDIEELVPCHCTGDEAYEYLSASLNCRVTRGHAGMRA